MAKLPIVKVGDPVLEQKATEVPKITKKITKLIDDMLDTMYEANGVGLAAPQVGVGQRIIVLVKDPFVWLIQSWLTKRGKTLMWRDVSVFQIAGFM